jgi:hypothetical protein
VVVGLPLTANGFSRTWSAAQLRDKQAPAYLQEFVQLLAENPISTDLSKCAERGVSAGLRKRRGGMSSIVNLPAERRGAQVQP